MGSGRYVILCAALTAGCVTADRAVPLYGGRPRARSEVARLTGPIRAVDGNQVDRNSSSFELLPGCHIVEIGGEIGRFDPNLGSGVSAVLPPLFYPFRMKAGGSYSIEFDPEPSLGAHAVSWGYVTARAVDRQGHIIPVPAAHTRYEIDECLRWSPNEQ